MKAGEISVVQYDVVHGGLRVMPLCSAAEIAHMQVLAGERPEWVVLGYATEEGKAHEQMQAIKREMKDVARPGNQEMEFFQ